MRIFTVKFQPDFPDQITQWQDQYKTELLTSNPLEDGAILPLDARPEVLYYSEEESGDLIGRFEHYNWNSRNGSMQFDNLVNPAHAEKGYGQLIVDHAISNLFGKHADLHKMYCQLSELNKNSIKILEGLGFRLDGVLRDHHNYRGKFYADRIYSVLRREWSASLK